MATLARKRTGAVWRSFRGSTTTVVAALCLALMVGAALLAPWIAPTDPYDPASLDIMNSSLPPAWTADGDVRFLLGTDVQGRDLLSAMLYGTRVSLMIGGASVLVAMTLGVALGLIAGYAGGAVDAFIMRTADVQLAFPPILVALLLDGVARGLLPSHQHAASAIWVLILSIAVSKWVLFARPVRAACLVERNKEYVQAARLMRIGRLRILFAHILPNVMGPVLVIGTLGLGIAVLIEASLSFLGVGMPPTMPSLGTLVSMGKDYIASGEWWVTVFPGLAIGLLVLSVNLVGDWLRDALNPKLRMAR